MYNTFRHEIRQDFNNSNINSIVALDKRWNKVKDITNKVFDVVAEKQKKTKKNYGGLTVV